MAKLDGDIETYSEEETVGRREAALKRAFAMPHKPHKEKGGRPKPPAPKDQNNSG
jgi:hypothetical protein